MTEKLDDLPEKWRKEARNLQKKSNQKYMRMPTRTTYRDMARAISLKADELEAALAQERQEAEQQETIEVTRLLEAIEKCGIDTSEWDGDDDVATIIARGIHTAIERAVENAQKAAAKAAPPPPVCRFSKDEIDAMVDRFLGWRLPENFCPDAGISFEPEFNVEYMAKQGKPPMRHEPTGTNLFDAMQAREMILHILGIEWKDQ